MAQSIDRFGLASVVPQNLELHQHRSQIITHFLTVVAVWALTIAPTIRVYSQR